MADIAADTINTVAEGLVAASEPAGLASHLRANLPYIVVAIVIVALGVWWYRRRKQKFTAAPAAAPAAPAGAEDQEGAEDAGPKEAPTTPKAAKTKSA